MPEASLKGQTMKDLDLFKYDRQMKLGMPGDGHPDLLFPKPPTFEHRPSSNNIGGTLATPATF
jgi:hypothetical protein